MYAEVKYSRWIDHVVNYNEYYSHIPFATSTAVAPPIASPLSSQVSEIIPVMLNSAVVLVTVAVEV